MITLNKGEWSEPYALLKLLADGELHLGDHNLEKIKDAVYPIISIIHGELKNSVEFFRKEKLVIIHSDSENFEIPIAEFIEKAKFCFDNIKKSPSGTGSFSIPEIEDFFAKISITKLKASSKTKNDITIMLRDSNSPLPQTLGFSIKSQIGSPSTLVNASGATNFIFRIQKGELSMGQMSAFDSTKEFSDKMKLLSSYGFALEYVRPSSEVFLANMRTVDYYLDSILARMLIHYFSDDSAANNTVRKFIEKITTENPLEYNLTVNPSMYELMMKRFLSEYALGMRAAEVWKRDYQASGGYLIVKSDGDIICYHVYFAKQFEEYLFNNTKLETPGTTKHGYGKIYNEDAIQLIKLNLQIRFIK